MVWRFSGLRGLRNCWRDLRSGVFLVGLVLEFFSQEMRNLHHEKRLESEEGCGRD